MEEKNISKAIPPATPFITLAAVREKLDIGAAIRREVKKISKGRLISEDEMARLTSGKDRSRFRRAVDNNADEFRAHRVKLRLEDGGDGKYFWGQASDIEEAVRIRDL